ncbi:phosphatidylserine/phosphatidylglycerophosphate/cardiolipin synthase family protein [Phenylobacterium sp.]|uniref:phosphatidylserine/phosphatidylglycerophosphate/ cardiolipin synthase family protein n=1 Tax=Phenylobacterium sp. TaxID=1871053 RepID=UPI0037C9D4CC
MADTVFQALASNEEAYCSRVALIRSAQARIDIQTYILTPDITGSGLIREMEAAAGRGVAIRLLLDDYGSHEAKTRLDRLRRMPGVEVRYVNPSKHQGLARRVDYIVDFRRLNRRMHNKSFIVDDQTAIVGGRNIGDVYFRSGEVMFADLDVIVEGAALADLRRVFDLYWNSPVATPLDEIAPLPLKPRAQQDPTPEQVPACAADQATASAPMQTASTVVLSDPPSKIDRDRGTEPILDPIQDQIRQELASPSRSLYIVSPYFIPSDGWVDDLVALRARGVEVRILTNSALATNSSPVHAAYSKYRRELTEGGVRLFEFKPTAAPVQDPELELGTVRSRSTLHAKTFAVDGEKVFVGSFNFDPRSVDLNSEMGLILRSPAAASTIQSLFESGLRTSAYEVQSSPGGLVWIDRGGDAEKVLDREPGLNLLRRAWLKVLAIAPIEHLL